MEELAPTPLEFVDEILELSAKTTQKTKKTSTHKNGMLKYKAGFIMFVSSKDFSLLKM